VKLRNQTLIRAYLGVEMPASPSTALQRSFESVCTVDSATMIPRMYGGVAGSHSDTSGRVRTPDENDILLAVFFFVLNCSSPSIHIPLHRSHQLISLWLVVAHLIPWTFAQHLVSTRSRPGQVAWSRVLCLIRSNCLNASWQAHRPSFAARCPRSTLRPRPPR